MRKSWRLAAVTVFVLSILVGGLVGDRVLALSSEVQSRLRLFTELVAVVHERYGTEVPYRDLVYSSIEGMLQTLDPHTGFLSAEAYATMRERQQSSFYGLGILVGMRNGALTVITPLDGTPAHRLGIRAGDVISTIEGESTETLSLNEAVRQLKGPRGTEVTIQIVRPGLPDPIEFTIERDEIPQNTVRYAYMIAPEVGYLMLSDFSRATGKEMSDAIERLKGLGMKRLLLDLRANGGGLLDQAIDVADQFLPEGAKIVETRGRTRDSQQEYFAAGRYPGLDLPVVVLVGGATASAAEILAGAIQDHDVGLIVGTPTWGKGLVQTVYSLGYGNGLALTTAKYYTPSGRLIQRDYTSWYDYVDHGEAAEEAGEPDGFAPQTPEEYTTDLGRKVYGGGGITPDVVTEQPRLPIYFDYLQAQNAFFNFAVEYSSRTRIPDRTWEPPKEILGEFGTWLEAHGMGTAEQLEAAMTDDFARRYALRQIHAEIFNSAFGFEARHQVLANIDPEIQQALGLFDEAEELLAQRMRKESGEAPAA